MPWTYDSEARFRSMWAAGDSVATIAESLGKSQSAVKNMRRRLGLPPRRTGTLTHKIRTGLGKDEYDLLARKARRHGQTVPGRVRHLIRNDLRTP